MTLTEPFRKNRSQIQSGAVRKILDEGAERARAIARETIREVRQAVGMS